MSNKKYVVVSPDNTSEEVNIHRAERNFVNFPFFDLNKKSRRDRLEISESRRIGNKEITYSWKVTRDIDSNFPSSLARRIHKTIVEKIINGMSKPIKNPIYLGSLRDIGRQLGNKHLGGRNAKLIRQALEDIQNARVKSKKAFYDKGKKAWVDKSFSFYDRVIFFGEELDNGKISDGVYIYLGTEVLENINNGYTVPLDYGYMLKVKGDITARMYELLSLDFFVAFEHHRKAVEKDYLRWVPFFPITPQNKLWLIKKQLKMAIDQHVESGFFSHPPKFERIPGQRNWNIIFYPGPKAWKDYNRATNRNVAFSNLVKGKVLDVSNNLSPTENLLSSIQKEMITFLESKGVNRAEALLLSSPHSDEVLESIKEDFENKIFAGFNFKNGEAAWLAWAISNSKYRVIKPTKAEQKENIYKTEEIIGKIRLLIEKIDMDKLTHFKSPSTGSLYPLLDIYTSEDLSPMEWSFRYENEEGRSYTLYFRDFVALPSYIDCFCHYNNE